MPLLCLDSSPEWDFPVFKVLAPNDTGATGGHMGGPLIPMDLRPFFPGLSGNITAITPTIDHWITAELFVENTFRGAVSTRYQFQSWGGTRSPEARLTGQLGPIYNESLGDDVLVIQRRKDALDHYRLTLVRRTSDLFAEISAFIRGRRWGVLTENSPLVAAELDEAIESETIREAAPFHLFEESAAVITVVNTRMARSLAFRARVIGLYGHVCAICGECLITPTGLLELDAAHVVPRALAGADDARNGLALCKRHHWAFDRGLLGVADDRTLIVAQSAALLAQNALLLHLSGVPIREAENPALRVDSSAFGWHRENTLIC